MSRRKFLVMGLAAVAFAVVLGFPSTALAAYTNPDCVGCHSTAIGAVAAQDFGVGAVDFTTACKKCHDDSLVGTHPYHNPASNCGSSCHPGWGASLVSAVPNYLDSRGYGAFASANSADTDPAILHLIHSKPRWMESKEFSFSKCGSCHAVATCDSCHDNPPAPDDVTHANHATSLSLSPWMGNTSSGVTNGNQTENTYVLNNSNRCGAVGCHDTAGVSSSAPGFLDDKSHTANTASGYLANVVTKTPTTAWRVMFSNVYTLGQISQSNTTSSTLSVPFTGEQFILVSDKDPYRGIAQVLVDDVPLGTVDLYQDTTSNQVEVFKSPILSSGPHTITVRVTGTKNPLARAAYVRVDQFKVYSNAPGKVAPECTSCHPSNAGAHGMGNFSHEATGSAAATFSGKRCDSCHSMPMTTEHSRVSSVSSATGCDTCHTTYAPKAITAAWDTTCAYGTCHVAASPREPHTAMAAGHTPTSDAAEAACRGCHAGDLAAIHNNSITTNTAVSTCNSCHTPTKFPATKSCVDSSCHGTSVNGVTSVDAHNFNTAKHTATPMTSDYQGVSPTVSNGGKDCSVCHSARVDTAHTGVTGGTVSCTTGGAGNTGCHNNTTLNGREVASSNWTTKKCSECHNYSANSSHDATVAPHAVAVGTCAGTTGCHPSTDLWELHSKSYAGTAPKYASCANTGCHDASNMDDRPTLKTCGTGNECHSLHTIDNHGYNGPMHTATDANSLECLGCHTSTDLYTLHSNNCNTCHNNSKYSEYNGGDLGKSATYGRTFSTTGCLACHVVPPMAHTYTGHTSASGHYTSNLTTHTAAPSQMTALFTGAVLSEKGAAWTSPTTGVAYNYTCSSCHVNTLMDEHAMTGATFTNVPTGTRITDGCTGCHNSANFATNRDLWTASKNCNTCHKASGGSAPAAHGSMAAKHNASARPIAQRCGGGTFGTDCHDISDVSKIHTKDTTGDGNIESITCISACHKGSAQGSRPTEGTGLDCGNAGCHDGAGSWWELVPSTSTNAALDEHALHHDTQSVNRVDGNLQTGTALSATESTLQCKGCHEINRLDRDHYALTGAPYGTSPWSGQTGGYPTSFAGKACAPCHRKTTNTTTPSTVPSATVKTAIARDDMKCPTCHTGTSWNATSWKMHQNRGTGQTAANTEFNSAYSGHRSFTFMRGVIPTMTVPAQTTYSITMPTVNVFRSGVTLQPGSRTLSTTSMTYCDDCHDYTGATGPHGAAMTIGIETGYNMTNTVYLLGGTTTGSTEFGFSAANYLCSKCHDLYGTTSGASNWSNNVHGDSNHRGNSTYGRCGQCHVRVAHAWKRPRLLVRHVSGAYGVDVAPYADSTFTASGMNGFDQLDYTTLSTGANTSWVKSECQAGCYSGHPRDGTIWP